MSLNESEFMKRLLATFKLEAEEHLQAMSACLAALEGEPDDAGVIETVFREAHSLKGAARAVNLGEVARLCHRLEDIFSEWKSGRLAPAPVHLAAMHLAMDELGEAMDALDPDHPEGLDNDYSAVKALKQIDAAFAFSPVDELSPSDTPTPPAHEPLEISDAQKSEAEAPDLADPVNPEAQTAPAAKVHRQDTVRIAAARMDSILLQTEELLGIKLAATQRAADLARLCDQVREWTRNENRSDMHLQEDMSAVVYQLTLLSRDADRDQRAFSSMLDGLMWNIKQAMMLPVATLLEGIPRLVRDLAREQRKEVELVVEGEQIEVDRRVLEELRDPIIHIVRNAIDHAIELPEDRTRKGKLARGRISIVASQRENHRFELRIADDGRGFDTDGLRTSAVRSGTLSAQAAREATPGDIAQFAFHSGVTTSPLITDISGRGLGLAIVQTKIERLGGNVSLNAAADTGSEMVLQVPITLATYRGILVRCAGQVFLLPTHGVQRVLKLEPEAVESVEGKAVLRTNGLVLSLCRLSDILGLTDNTTSGATGQSSSVLVIRAAASQLALSVDEVIAEQEVLVKSLGRQLVRVRHIAGAAILGSGALVPILYLPDLVKTAVSGVAEMSVRGSLPQEKRIWRILLAEDSITARTLLKTILETSGYMVFPAVDGAEAWTLLRTNEIDLVVSDVEMPRLNGFELTARIRANKKLEQIPVILVTALESRDDRERGIEAGANAYIVKSSFDQSNLFETIQRLL